MDPFLNDFLKSDADAFQTSTKTEEEIKKLTLEENMSEIKRTIHILARGQPLQKISVYSNLHRILLESDAFNKVLPLVTEDLVNQNKDNQVEAAKSLTKLIHNKGITDSNVIQIFHIACSILKVWDQPVLDEWALVFNEIIKRIPYEMISKECELLIMSLTETTQHSLSKYVALRLIGFVAENGIKNINHFFDRARILCLDPDFEIRKVLAEEVMLKICFNAGTELTESKYLEKIMELLYDSNIKIKLAAIDSLVKVLDILSYDFRKTKMVQIFLELMSSVNDEVTKKMSFLVGTILYKLEDVLPKNSNQLVQFQNIYREWSVHKSAEVKKNVVYNLPYMIQLCDNKDYLQNFYLKVLKDPSNPALRIMAVGCFHEICKIYKPEESIQVFKETFEGLLKETDNAVIEKLVNNLADLLPVFQGRKEDSSVEDDIGDKDREEEKEKDKSKKKPKEVVKSPKDSIKDLTKDVQTVSYLQDLLNIAEKLKMNCLWRLEIVFMSNMEKCFDCFDIRELGEKYVDYLLERAVGGLKEVQPAAVNSLISFLKRNHVSKKTGEIMDIFTKTLGNSKSYQNRMLYLDIYDKLAANFSKRFFKTHGLNEMVIKLGDDKVADVRKKLFLNCVTVRRMLSQGDSALINRLEEAASRNKTDKNKYVADAARDALKEVRSLTQFFFTEFDMEDKNRMTLEDDLRDRELRELDDAKKKQNEDLQKKKSPKKNSIDPMTSGLSRSYVQGQPLIAQTQASTRARLAPGGYPPMPSKSPQTTSSQLPEESNLKIPKPITGKTTSTNGLAQPNGLNKQLGPGPARKFSDDTKNQTAGKPDMNKYKARESLTKNDPRNPIIGKSPQESEIKAPKDFVKVPTIKRKL